MFRNLFFTLLVAPLLVLLAGCCGNTPCNCQDSRADALYFSFKVTGPGAFSHKEIKTVYLARYDTTNLKVSRDSLPLVIKQRVDTALAGRLARLRPVSVDTSGLLILNNSAPFSATTTGGKLSGYRYRLYVPQDSAGTFKKHSFTTYTFDRIRLIGRYQTDGCCTCYENSLKRLRILGGNYTDSTKFVNATEVSSSSNQVPFVIQLTK